MISRQRKERRATEAEIDLWRRAVVDAAPLDKNIATTTTKRVAKPHVSRRYIVSSNLPPAHSKSQPQPIDRNTLARLRNGRMEIEGKLDLHGLTANQARRALAAFLSSSHAIGRRAVLVITGRGLNPDSNGPGVIKRETPSWLNQMSDLVSSYGQADKRHGGEGALYVRLKRKKGAKNEP